MAAGGWSLSHMWLTDGILSKNWPLVQELLELLLCCPVDVTRLKSNSSPKLVKGLSKDGGHEGKFFKNIFFIYYYWNLIILNDTYLEKSAK